MLASVVQGNAVNCDRNAIIGNSSEKDVGWFVLSVGQRFLYLFDANIITVEQISLCKPVLS